MLLLLGSVLWMSVTARGCHGGSIALSADVPPWGSLDQSQAEVSMFGTV